MGNFRVFQQEGVRKDLECLITPFLESAQGNEGLFWIVYCQEEERFYD